MENITNYMFHQDPKVFRVNEMEDRAYFIPFESEEMTGEKRERSAFFFSLNGEWKFRYRASVYDMEDFYIENFDCTEFSTVTVPETWQTHGTDAAQYQASAYTFPFDPPHVPEKNPCAAYVKEFDFAPKAGKTYELHFEGKDSCVYVWMNGEWIGYGECPHCDSTFDVTRALQNGKNRLCVLVLKWCSGSYLDDQDKIRLSGLFRDVYLLERSEKGLADVHLATENNGTVTVFAKSASPVHGKLQKDGVTLCECDFTNGSATLKVEDPLLWSAEKPQLYDLILACDGEYVRLRFGFREVCVRENVFTVNGRAVKLYGVNRHDSSPDTGYVTDFDFMRHELVMMKQHNINAIRTSHYPNDPRFYELCDELGFYVLCEADMECHGCTYVEEWDKIITEPTFAAAIHDRIDRMYQACKNFTCICIWSLGNESSWGENLKNEAIYLKKTDPSRTLHYEGWRGGEGDAGSATVLTEEERDFIKNTFDFHSRMYPTLEKMKNAFGEGSIGLPYVMCEFSHAMGNSCGDLRFYDEIMQSDPRYVGGFVWEWCDHALRLQDENGVSYLGYGGDFGEHHHLGNVCMDGLVNPDRQPHSSLLELKAVYAPVRVTRDSDGTLVFTNRSVFTDLNEYDTAWSVAADGRETLGGRLDVTCAPGESVRIAMPCVGEQGEDAVLTVKVLTRGRSAWNDGGHTVAAFSFRLEERKAPTRQPSLPAPTVSESRSAVTVSGNGFSYVFRKDTGILTELILGGKSLLAKPMEWTCFRAPTDNDNTFQTKRNVYLLWNKTKGFGNIEYPEIAVRHFAYAAEAGCVRLWGDFLFSVQGRMPISIGTVEYTVMGDGTLRVEQRCEISEKLPYWLPRYGYALAFAEPLCEIEYFGYGPAECYEDKRTHALLGRYAYVQDDPFGAYETPQESGSHCGTEWLTAKTMGQTLKITGDFSFCASRYDVHTTTRAAHRKDLVPSQGTNLYIDYRMSGVGSASCGGQAPVPECRINPGEKVDFTMEIKPVF